MTSPRLRSLTGVKPTGVPHVGNYLGAMRPAIELSRTHDSFLFIADLHALTTARDPKRLTEETFSVAATWLAAGVDPKTTVFYKQTDVPEIATLAWILSCFTPLGLLNRAHSVKDARQKSAGPAELALPEDAALAGKAGAFDELEMDINHGVFAYPVLMAADILLYDTDVVPVGKDQKQHVEIAQEIARKINFTYGGEVLKVPKARIDEEVMTIPGIDGRKMSKSYDNGIELFLTDKEWKKRIAQIKTDSTPYGSPLSPDGDTIFSLVKAFSPERAQELERQYRAGRRDPARADRDAEDNWFGWGHAKAALLDTLIEVLGPIRSEYHRLMADRAHVRRLLAEGGERAREVARQVLRRVTDATGLVA